MYYYQYQGRYYCSLAGDLPLNPLPPEKFFDECFSPPKSRGQDFLGEPVFLFQRPIDSCRAAFAVSAAGQLWETEEGIHWLDTGQMAKAQAMPAQLEELIEKRGLRAVNFSHPRWQELAAYKHPMGKKRLNLLALGDVGSTLLMGLRLLGGGLIESIGIYDADESRAKRWEFEINQISPPLDYQRLPQVEIILPEQLFDCHMFVFCAAKNLPPVGARVGDVRLAQLEENAALVGSYARQAREAGFGGIFAVVSDPVDLLCKAAFSDGNRGADGTFDGQGLFAQQIQGYGLGVMNARAAYYARQEPRFATFFSEGRAFGPHGGDLVIANSLENYDDALSRELTDLAVNANLCLRELGYKPFVAPALSSGTMALLATLAGEWHYSSTFLGGVYMGAYNRFTPCGLEVEALPLPPALFSRIQQAADNLRKMEI